ncbi:MAG: flagellar biosynthesis anti-sigma factor FlgM [Pyrinomonadaceae bacterium]
MSRINLNGANDAEVIKTGRRADADRAKAAEQMPAQNAGDAAATPQADTVKVSDTAASVGRLANRASEMSDVRQERIDALREVVESGSYRPEAGDIADAILKEEG